MRKTNTIFLSIIFLFISIVVNAIPAKPGKIEYKLPDGTSIGITLKGDEKINWAETEDGYSLLLNKEGFYEYATLNENGDMVRSGIRAYNSNERTQEQMSFVSKLDKKVHFSRSQVNLMHQIWDIHEKEGTKAFPTTGNRKLICVLMGFQDQAFTKNQADFNDLYNQVGYSIDGATGSVKDYYLENSLLNEVMRVAVAKVQEVSRHLSQRRSVIFFYLQSRGASASAVGWSF